MKGVKSERYNFRLPKNFSNKTTGDHQPYGPSGQAITHGTFAKDRLLFR